MEIYKVHILTKQYNLINWTQQNIWLWHLSVYFSYKIFTWHTKQTRHAHI